MIKFQHTLFALPFAFTGAILAADGLPSRGRSAGSWGRWSGRAARRDLQPDRRPRFRPQEPAYCVAAARDRELGLGFAWSALALSVALFFLSAFRLNRLSFLLAAPAILLVLSYSYAKRLSG